MIDLFTGEFMFHPASIEISGNRCSYNCAYCFANLRKSSRYSNFNSIISRLTRTNPVVLLDYMLKDGYPICMSNRTDPLSATNIKETLAIAPYLSQRKNGLFVQTKGGDVESFISSLNGKKEVVFYLSITMTDDKLRKKIEPQAPSIEERIQIAKHLHSLGYLVIVAYNPLIEEWLPFDEMSSISMELLEYGINHIVIEPLHLSSKEIANMPMASKSNISTNVQNNAKRGDANLKYCRRVLRWLLDNGFVAFKLGMPHPTELFNDIAKKLGKISPNLWQVINHCNKKESDDYFLGHDEYLQVLIGDEDIYQRQFKNIANNYILKYAFNDWKGNDAIQNITTLREAITLYWDLPKIRCSCQNNRLFLKVVDNGKPVMSNGHIVLYYNRQPLWDWDTKPRERVYDINNNERR